MSKFIQYGNKTLTMPEGMTLEQAKQLMARHFPELAENPKVDTKKEGDDTTYIFSKQAGRKGATDAQRAARRLQRLKPIDNVPAEIERVDPERIALASPRVYDDLSAEIQATQRVAAQLVQLAPQGETGSILL